MMNIKKYGLNPSCSLKDGASFLIVAEAIRLGKNKIVVVSRGNAASALAAVAASAGKKAKIFVPKSAPIAKLVQMFQHVSLNDTRKNGGLNRKSKFYIERMSHILEVLSSIHGALRDSIRKTVHIKTF